MLLINSLQGSSRNLEYRLRFGVDQAELHIPPEWSVCNISDSLACLRLGFVSAVPRPHLPKLVEHPRPRSLPAALDFPVLLDAPFAVGLALQQPFLRLPVLCSCCIHVASSPYGAGKVGSHSHMSRKNLSWSCA